MPLSVCIFVLLHAGLPFNANTVYDDPIEAEYDALGWRNVSQSPGLTGTEPNKYGQAPREGYGISWVQVKLSAYCMISCVFLYGCMW